jgi:hypothetical protein
MKKRTVKDLKPSISGLIVPEGELLCSTNYVLSHAFSEKTCEGEWVCHLTIW